MSDIKCVVCGETWDAWGVSHGDMMAWETDLFRAGVGCPCCKGDRSEGSFEPKGISDFNNGDDDPMQRIIAWENPPEIKWEKPQDEVLNECDGCGIRLVRLLSEEVYDGRMRQALYDWYRPTKSRALDWYRSHSDTMMGPAEEAAKEHKWNPWEDDRRACPCCAGLCDCCGEVIIAKVPDLDPGDCYASGASMMHPHDYAKSICINCFEELNSEEEEEEEEECD